MTDVYRDLPPIAAIRQARVVDRVTRYLLTAVAS